MLVVGGGMRRSRMRRDPDLSAPAISSGVAQGASKPVGPVLRPEEG